jgi:hypothetical protein
MPDDDLLETEEFYNLMQEYRHAPIANQDAVVAAYEAVKEYLRRCLRSLKEKQ